jgi:hypothetical protein
MLPLLPNRQVEMVLINNNMAMGLMLSLVLLLVYLLLEVEMVEITLNSGLNTIEHMVCTRRLIKLKPWHGHRDLDRCDLV